MRNNAKSKVTDLPQNKLVFQQQRQILGEINEIQPNLNSHRQSQPNLAQPPRTDLRKPVLKQVRSQTKLQQHSKLLTTKKCAQQKSASNIENSQLNQNEAVSSGPLISFGNAANGGGKSTPSHQAIRLPPVGAHSPQQLHSQPLRTIKRGKVTRPDFDEAHVLNNLISQDPDQTEFPFASLIRKERKTDLTKKHQNVFQTLSYDLITLIFEFLGSLDVIRKAQSLSLFFYRNCQRQILWQRLSPNTVNLQMRKIRILCERRSKGKLFLCESRLTGEKFTVRRVQLNVANAGLDDGVPMSILREFNNCQALQDQDDQGQSNVNFISNIEVKDNEVTIAQPFINQNLREFIKANQVRKICETPLLRKLRDCRTFQGLQPQNLLKVFKDLIQGVAHCHRRSVFHRNIKPDNILITEDLQVKLSDFALSRFEIPSSKICTPEDPKERDRSGREARRLWYRAPELLLRKREYSKEIDMWSLGCILAELAIGDALFKGQSEIEQLFFIYAMTGSPDSETLSIISNGDKDFKIAALPNWQEIKFTDICEKETAIEVVNQMVHPMRKPFLEKLLMLNQCIGKEGLDLLSKLLHLNPQKRINAEQALNHPFFQKIQNPERASQEQSSDIYLNKQSAQPIQNPLQTHTQITPRMRQILVDWLVDVGEHFDQKSSTLHFAIELLDLYLSLEKSSQMKSELQLLGTCCLKIADQFNERSREYYRQDNARDYASITADEYTSNQIIACEKRILQITGFKVLQVSSHQWVNSILQTWKCKPSDCDEFNAQQKKTVQACAEMLADWSLLGQEIRGKFSKQIIGYSCVLIACLVCQITPPNMVITDLNQIKECVRMLRDLWGDCTTEGSVNARFVSIKKKYLKHSLPNCPSYTQPINFDTVFIQGEEPMQID